LRTRRIVDGLRRLRPPLGQPGAALFVSQFILFDALMRGLPSHRAVLGRALGAASSMALWGLAWSHRRRRWVRLCSSIAAGLLVTIDLWVYRYYGTPLDRQVVTSALHNWADVRPIVARLFPWIAFSGAVMCALERSLLGSATPPLRDHAARVELRASLVVLAAVLAVVTPPELATPDMRAMRALAMAARRVTPDKDAFAAPSGGLPVLPSAKTELPNVLLILTESVRAETYCVEPRSGCPFTPELDRVLPDRIGLGEMRSVASYTAVSAAALLTGRTQERPRAELTLVPTIFDYARAVRVGDKRPTTAYWSAQSASVLEGDVRGSVDSWATLETLLGRTVEDDDDVVELGMDAKLRTYFVRELPRLPRPFVLVAHLLGTHAPYYVDEANAPFRPVGHVAGWGSLRELQNAYQDAVIAQDHEVAACVEAFLAAQGSSPWVIFFTSDHGEAFGEHGAIHHGQNLYDEQIHVPAWIASGGGALDAEEHARLLARRDAFVTHLDVVPTLLDALGVWRGLAMAGPRSHLLGQSLLEAQWVERAIPITNCTELFPCPLNTWGVLEGAHALEAQAWDGDWNCVDLASGKEHTTGPSCDALSLASRRYFSKRPNGRSNTEPPGAE
jgi:glucan phosphoethanolaminetransferase (alkaline phosphatase superfamily)